MFAIWTHTDGSDPRSALCRLLLWLLGAACARFFHAQQACTVTGCINYLPKILLNMRTVKNLWQFLYRTVKKILCKTYLYIWKQNYCKVAEIPRFTVVMLQRHLLCKKLNSRLTLLRRLPVVRLMRDSVLHMRIVLSAEQLKNSPEEPSPAWGSSLAPGYIWGAALSHHSLMMKAYNSCSNVHQELKSKDEAVYRLFICTISNAKLFGLRFWTEIYSGALTLFKCYLILRSYLVRRCHLKKKKRKKR